MIRRHVVWPLKEGPMHKLLSWQGQELPKMPKLIRGCGLREAACAALLAAVPFATTSFAQSPAQTFEANSLLGSYLAGRYAKSRYDVAIAASYYRSALRRDPDNIRLMVPALQMLASNGDWDEAVPLARRLLLKHKSHRVANLVVGLDDIVKQEFSSADAQFKAASISPIGKLTGTLARSWARLARGDGVSGVRLLSNLRRAEGGKYHVDYHTALIADLSGRRKTAEAAFRRVFKQEPASLRVTLAYARHAAHAGNYKRAAAILKKHMKHANAVGRIVANALLRKVQNKEKISLLVKTPREGLAEVFYGLGEALIGVGAVPDGTIYLQMALFMKPNMPFALEALANVYEATKKYDLALETYDKVPNASPLQSTIAIRKAENLNRLDRLDEARELLETQAAREPKNMRPLVALGDIMRARKKYREAITYYDRVLKLVAKPEAKHWSFYFSRGTCYERTKNWKKAEADLKRALQLSPNQPQVLNYLGYSWVDQMMHLKKGMQLIEKAVRLKPGDGYIVDSLGWAHYRLKNYRKAVEYLNRAVELRPEDPTLNDHLGDALWRVGRQLEARYQWQQALTLKPEPADAIKMRKKLKSGLPPIKQAKVEKHNVHAE